jgi:hypothetical protein
VRVPETLLESYPELEKIAGPEPSASAPTQSDLLFATGNSPED